MDVTGSDHLPIQSILTIGASNDSVPSSLFKLNVSHLEFDDFRALVRRVWTLSLRPVGDHGWILWWEAAVCRTVKFIRGCSRMIACRRRRELKEARSRLEEVRIFLEENSYNVSLQEEAAKLEMAIRKAEDYIARGAKIRARLHWIQEGDEGSKFFFSFLKRKVAADRVIGLRRGDGSITEDPAEIKDMFG